MNAFMGNEEKKQYKKSSFHNGNKSIFLGCLYLWFLFLQISGTHCLHLTGTWNSNDFFLFLTKFGFQKTDPKDLSNTQGYIYGNISFVQPIDEHTVKSLALVVVDSEYFLEFYGNRTLPPIKACPAMFHKIDTIAFDYICKQNGREDFLRKIPCPPNKLCVDEDNPSNVVPGYQFTYKVEDVQRPRYVPHFKIKESFLFSIYMIIFTPNLVIDILSYLNYTNYIGNCLKNVLNKRDFKS